MATSTDQQNVQLDKEKKQFEKDLKEMFAIFDKNGDNSISVGEFSKALKKMGFEMTTLELKAAVKQIDSNRNGKIEFGEFRNFMLKQFKRSEKDGDGGKEMRQAFRLFDKDGSGFIDKQEIRRAMKALGEPMTESEAAMMIKDGDRNGDGKIDFEEFVVMWKQKCQV